MITFTDVENNEYQAQCEIEKIDAVNGEKSLSGTIYFGQDIKSNIAKGWTLSFLDEEYVVVTYTKNDKDNTVAFSAVQAFFYKMSKTGFYETWNGSHPFTGYLDALFSGTGYTYDNMASVAAFEKQDWGMSDRLSLFNGIVDQANVEFYVEGTAVHIVPAMGSDLSTIVRKKFNLDTAEIQTDNTSFATYGRGYGAYSNPDDTTSSRLEVEYKSPLYDYYYPKFGAIEAVPVADGRYTVPENLLAAVKGKVDRSWEISLTLNLVDLQSVGYKYTMANPGDYITVIDENLNFSDKVRIIKVTSNYDIRGKRTKTEVECGNLSFAEQQKAAQSTLSNVAAGKIQVPPEWLTSKVQQATNSLLAAQTELNFTDQGIIAVDKSDSNKVIIINSKGIAFENSSPHGFNMTLRQGEIDFNGPNGEHYGKLTSTINLDTGKPSGAALINAPGRTLTLSQDADDGTSVSVFQIPADSTKSNPRYKLNGHLRSNLVFDISKGARIANNGAIELSANKKGNQLEVNHNGVAVTGDFTVYKGTKNAASVTRDGIRATPAYETAENYVGDIGESKTGDDNIVQVSIDPLIYDIGNTEMGYQVFITPYADARFWVSEREDLSFTVNSDTPNAPFAWELKAHRRGSENRRLVDTGKTYEDLEKMEGLITNGNQNVQSNS